MAAYRFASQGSARALDFRIVGPPNRRPQRSSPQRTWFMTATPLQILQNVFGYEAFRGNQHEIINELMEGRDALVLMPTGGGKSLCYQIPAIARPGVGIVISPLIALMQDQVDALTQVGIRASFLNSTLSASEVFQTEQALLNGEL